MIHDDANAIFPNTTTTAAINTPPVGQIVIFSEGDKLKQKNSAGAVTSLSGNTKATAASSAAINTAAVYIAPSGTTNGFAIPANSLTLGDVFRITAFGRCTSTLANVSTFVPRLGAAGSTADTSLGSITATSAVTGTNVGFTLQITITVRAIGAAGAVQVNWTLLNNGITGISANAVAVSGASAQTTINTTGALILGLSYSSAAITTTTTFEQVIVEKLN